jgi:general stress protein 26
MNDNLKDFEAEIWKRFKNHPHIFLASQENNQPRVRPVTLVNFDQRFWVLTGTRNAKVKQIRENPKIEFCMLFKEGGHHGYIRAAGFAEIINDRETKVKAAKHCDFFGEHWESLDDPNYTLLELKLKEIEYLRPNENVVRKFKL